jgi:hypothetical protein
LKRRILSLFHNSLISRYEKERSPLMDTVLKVPIPEMETEEFGRRPQILTRSPNLHDELDVNISEELIDFLLENRQPILEPLV